MLCSTTCLHTRLLYSVIREWSIHSGLCLREMYGHEAFVYRYKKIDCDSCKCSLL